MCSRNPVILRPFLLVLAFVAAFWHTMPASAQTGAVRSPVPSLDEALLYQAALQLFDADAARRRAAIDWFRGRGKTDAVPALIIALRYERGLGGRRLIRNTLKHLTGAQQESWFDWMQWLQAHPQIKPFEDFAAFRGGQLAALDPSFARFIHQGVDHTIRLEEIVWGGVPRDGIPDLSDPKFIGGGGPTYLNDGDLVFGVEINGDARAYPLRILDWHELLNDVVGGVPVSLAYCTLCGSGILYESRPQGRDKPFVFGTSGLLYRSNKLMYDRATWSLWNQFTGTPVVGPLTRSGIKLKVRPMVITTWQAWRKRHPQTKLLSRDTGHERDYSPGAAYGDYFAGGELMFPAPTEDRRLEPKDLVFVLRASGAQKAWPLSRFKGGAVVNDRAGLVPIVLVGNAEARTVRAYRAGAHRFEAGPDPDTLRAEDATIWRITEAALIGPEGERLNRLPGHIAFWFAWAGFVGDKGELADETR